MIKRPIKSQAVKSIYIVSNFYKVGTMYVWKAKSDQKKDLKIFFHISKGELSILTLSFLFLLSYAAELYK